jgi:hypothetical protein
MVSTRTIPIAPGRVKKFKIESVEVPDPSIKVKVMPFKDNSYGIYLEQISPTRELDGKALVIHTDAEGMREIRIPLHVHD